ncbi:site-specific integrase [Bacillus cereus]|nr:site-specific integrase [Bacillus cereus]
MSIKSYITNKGEKRYKFQVYLGIDPITGKTKKTTKQGFKTKKEASLEMSRLKLEAQKGMNQLSKKDYTYKGLYELWNESHALSIKESTQSNVKNIFTSRILPCFGSMKINKITVVHCQRVINKWAKQYRSFRDVRTYFSMVMNYAVNLGLIDFNPMDKVITPKLQVDGRTKTGKYFSVEELKKFLEYAFIECDIKMYNFFRLIAFTGMRKGECLALTWDDINFFSGELSINKTVYYINGRYVVSDPKTKTSKRVIDIDQQTLDTLKKWRCEQKRQLLSLGIGQEGNSNNLIFNKLTKNREHEHINSSIPNRELKNITDKYNLTPISVHGFRHTHCSLLFEAGLDVKAVQDRLGHGDVQTTLQIYSHVTEKMKQTSGEKFQRYVDF